MPNLEPREPHAGHDDDKDDVEGHGLAAEPHAEPHAGENDEETDDVEAHALLPQPNINEPNAG